MFLKKGNFWYGVNIAFYKRYYSLIDWLWYMFRILGHDLLDRDYLLVNSNPFKLLWNEEHCSESCITYMPSFVAAQCLNPNGSWWESDIQSSIKSRCLLSWFSLQPGCGCMTSDSANQINLLDLTPKYTLKEIEPEKKILAERKTALWEQC